MRVRILDGLGSRSLHCGCFVGVYETYDKETVEIIEERGGACSDPSHKVGHATVVSKDGDPASGKSASA